MKRFFSVGVCALSLVLVGCGDSGTKNIMEDADQAALQDYEAMVAADEAMMTEEDESGGTQEGGAETPAE